MPSSNPRYANYRARQRIRKQLEQDNSPCWICGLPIPAAKAGHPYAMEVDELVPISKGGSAIDRGNVARAHRCCNQWRSDKPVELVRSIAANAAAMYGRWRCPFEFIGFANLAYKRMRRGESSVKLEFGQVVTSRDW